VYRIKKLKTAKAQQRACRAIERCNNRPEGRQVAGRIHVGVNREQSLALVEREERIFLYCFSDS
jgi:hypothetical protein